MAQHFLLSAAARTLSLRRSTLKARRPRIAGSVAFDGQRHEVHRFVRATPRARPMSSLRDVDALYPAEGNKRFETEQWPALHEALEAPDPDEWERKQPFVIPNPPSGPWPKWDLLTIDPIAPIGTKTRVAAFGQSEKGFRQYYLGPVQGLRQKFTITDVRTGKVVNLADTGRVFYGAVVGMTRCTLDRNKRKTAVATQAAKPEKKTNGTRGWVAIGRQDGGVGQILR